MTHLFSLPPGAGRGEGAPNVSSHLKHSTSPHTLTLTLSRRERGPDATSRRSSTLWLLLLLFLLLTQFLLLLFLLMRDELRVGQSSLR